MREGILASGDALPPTQLAAGLITSPPSEAVRDRDVSAPIMHRRLRFPYVFRCFHGGSGSAWSPHQPGVDALCPQDVAPDSPGEDSEAKRGQLELEVGVEPPDDWKPAVRPADNQAPPPKSAYYWW